ncbi:HAMP domain-containing histidine kinase [Streptomyces ipomoeae]|nr:HAMP domain-containing histidine kinase [Streptomyces ipomoeae]
MWRPRNLRTKISLVVAGVAAGVAVSVGGLVHQLVARDQLDTARRELDAELLNAAAQYAAGGEYDGRLDPADLPAPVAMAVRDGRRVTYLQEDGGNGDADARGGDGPPVLWAAGRVSDRHVLAVRRSYRREAGALTDLDRALWVAGGLATGVASVGGLLLGARMGRRATRAAVTAESIADGDLDARVASTGTDEIARLAMSVNAMADALGGRLEAERRVTADIAHELRTPVAGVLTAASLLPPGQATDLVRNGAGNLQRLVEDVLEVARLDARAARVDVEERQVSVLARRAVEAVRGGSGVAESADVVGSGVAESTDVVGSGERCVRLRVVSDRVVETDPRRVERILANLAGNALKHGGGVVTVEVDGGVVRVRDEGPGFSEELLAVLRTSGPQRFRTGARTGTGLGLTIAVGQARLLGARLVFGNRVGGGAEVVLELPDAVPGGG